MSDNVRERFAELQQQMLSQLENIFPDRNANRSVVIIPSLSLDLEELEKIPGAHHYEERMICMLMLLRYPNTQIIYVTSQQIDPAIIDYYLHLLSGIPSAHAKKRLVLLDCNDASQKTLTAKILERPHMLQRIRDHIMFPEAAHITCFNATELERTLSVALDLPLYANNPDLLEYGGKSGSRKLFKEAGIELCAGREDLRDKKDIVDTIVELKENNPNLDKVVIKLNYGFSGEGNALLSLDGCPEIGSIAPFIEEILPQRIKFESAGETWDRYISKFAEMRGIVEEFIVADNLRSPSAQLRIDGKGGVQPISTHDQVLGGPSGQVFHGCYFPADQAYRLDVQERGLKVGKLLGERGALARYGVDFLSVPTENGWKHYAIEINLRKGGTTHPFMMLDYLVDGHYDQSTGEYVTPLGQTRSYRASDNLADERYKGLTPEDLIDIAVEHGLHYHTSSQRGVVFHLIGALSQFGKVGIECIAETRREVDELYARAVTVLDGVTSGG